MSGVERLLQIARKQIELLQAGDITGALELCKEREEIMEEVRHRKNSPGGENFSPREEKILEKIASVDRELIDIIAAQATIIKEQITCIQQVKSRIAGSSQAPDSKKSPKLNIRA